LLGLADTRRTQHVLDILPRRCLFGMACRARADSLRQRADMLPQRLRCQIVGHHIASVTIKMVRIEVN
jgi:hypothetical protein